MDTRLVRSISTSWTLHDLDETLFRLVSVTFNQADYAVPPAWLVGIIQRQVDVYRLEG